MNTTMTDKTVLVTGANRGIGHALVAEALRRGAKRVYAGTQALLLALIRSQGAVVVLVGPTDTDMSRGFDVPKVSPGHAAAAIIAGVQAGDEEIFPHPMLEAAAMSWRSGELKSLERQFAAFVEPAAVAS